LLEYVVKGGDGATNLKTFSGYGEHGAKDLWRELAPRSGKQGWTLSNLFVA
jgi:hypothetical protein